MNRLLVGGLLGVFAAFSFGCAPTGIGDPCIPEAEFSPTSGSWPADGLGIDVNSVQCESRVCLRHYFQGRVSCPYGNDGKNLRFRENQAGKQCRQVPGLRGFYVLTDPGVEAKKDGTPCCPILGSLEEKPLSNPVDPQCRQRGASDAVYCSCRCDVPDGDPEIDRNTVTLCKCPSGFACVPLCDATTGNCGLVPKGKWGSYCVREKEKNFNPAVSGAARCGGNLTPPI